MKKIITVLFTVFTIASVFAKPIEYRWKIDSTKFTAITDDENEPNDFSMFTDEAIIRIAKNSIPETLPSGEKLVYYSYNFFNEADEYCSKYYRCLMMSEDRKALLADFYIEDGRKLRLVYSIQK